MRTKCDFFWTLLLRSVPYTGDRLSQSTSDCDNSLLTQSRNKQTGWPETDKVSKKEDTGEERRGQNRKEKGRELLGGEGRKP
mmetsp:Transcript_36750/g.72318  ORF Transcript_36750/g.72318 Transcript_36750/m.72318 type:complete len:82 (-) Transcript_36750:215-460(-)